VAEAQRGDGLAHGATGGQPVQAAPAQQATQQQLQAIVVAAQSGQLAGHVLGDPGRQQPGCLLFGGGQRPVAPQGAPQGRADGLAVAHLGAVGREPGGAASQQLRVGLHQEVALDGPAHGGRGEAAVAGAFVVEYGEDIGQLVGQGQGRGDGHGLPEPGQPELELAFQEDASTPVGVVLDDAGEGREDRQVGGACLQLLGNLPELARAESW